MSDKIIAKQGETIRFHTCCHMLGSDRYEDYVLESDYTGKQLEEQSEEYMWETLAPEWRWERRK